MQDIELVRITNKNLIRYGQIGRLQQASPTRPSFMVGFQDGSWHRFFEGEFERLNPPASPPKLPPLMGLAEVAIHLQITTSRISRLRRDPRFPEPIAILRQGAVWDAEAIRRFTPRPSGRPKKS